MTWARARGIESDINGYVSCTTIDVRQDDNGFFVLIESANFQKQDMQYIYSIARESNVVVTAQAGMVCVCIY